MIHQAPWAPQPTRDIQGFYTIMLMAIIFLLMMIHQAPWAPQPTQDTQGLNNHVGGDDLFVDDDGEDALLVL